MLNKRKLIEYFTYMNDDLKRKNIHGEICICGGAVMCLEHDARKSTRDVDALSFAPATDIREAAEKIAKRFNLNPDWMNDGAKGFIETSPPKHVILDLSNLKIWAPDAGYMLAMKCFSARLDGHDKDDIAILIRHLKLKSEDEVTALIVKYYSLHRIPIQTRYIVKEIFENLVVMK